FKVPLASAANVLTTQVVGKPLTGTGGPKKQLASNAQEPTSPPQSASDVQVASGLLRQCWVVAGPREQSAGPVPKLATRLVPSGGLRIDEAFSGIGDGGIVAVPPPM